jgi:Arm DNA-binding domain
MAEIEEAEPQPDSVWDDQVRGLCVRVYGNGSKSFFFVYRINDSQRFIRIGKTPVRSLEAARKRAGKLRAVVDEGRDPARSFREPNRIDPVENVMRHIAEHRGE